MWHYSSLPSQRRRNTIIIITITTIIILQMVSIIITIHQKVSTITPRMQYIITIIILPTVNTTTRTKSSGIM